VKLKPTRVRLLRIPLLLALLSGVVAAQPKPVAAPAKISAAPIAELKLTDAIVLGVVEGVTEFLPISSTGHLIVATHVLGLDVTTQLKDADGKLLWAKAPAAERKPSRTGAIKKWALGLIGKEYKIESPEGVPLTLARAAATYTVVIQFGAIAAVVFLYWAQLRAIGRGLIGRDVAGLRLAINLLIAFLPAAAIGFLAHGWIDEHFTIGAVVAAQAVGAGLMLFAEHWRRRHYRARSTDSGENALAPHAAAGIGLLQVLALWPGMSRSMTTIVGGYFAGLDPRRSAEFSFLLGFVTLSAASVYKSAQSGAAMIQVFGWSHVLVGAVVAAITAAVCVRWLVGWLTQHGLAAFAYYRLGFAVLLAILFLR
jgi:undecaprenyl-diphosphatase